MISLDMADPPLGDSISSGNVDVAHTEPDQVTDLLAFGAGELARVFAPTDVFSVCYWLKMVRVDAGRIATQVI